MTLYRWSHARGGTTTSLECQLTCSEHADGGHGRYHADHTHHTFCCCWLKFHSPRTWCCRTSSIWSHAQGPVYSPVTASGGYFFSSPFSLRYAKCMHLLVTISVALPPRALVKCTWQHSWVWVPVSEWDEFWTSTISIGIGLLLLQHCTSK